MALVMVMWTMDKFVHPDHAQAVYAHFYYLRGISNSVMYTIGAIEMAVLLGFLVGFAKKWTYGAVLLFHAISTFSSHEQYMAPFQDANLLFFAAWPMLAACFTLFMLRDEDTLWSNEQG